MAAGAGHPETDLDVELPLLDLAGLAADMLQTLLDFPSRFVGIVGPVLSDEEAVCDHADDLSDKRDVRALARR